MSASGLKNPYDEGRRARQATPRRDLAQLADRPTDYDPLERLAAQSAERLASLRSLRYERMSADPLAFYRGGALLMAEDLARGPATSIEVQLCGDAHLLNFGIFSSPERQLVFDLTDFDETAPGPFDYDVKRLVASLVIAADHVGYEGHVQERLAFEAAREYQGAMRRFSDQTRLEVWYAALDVAALEHDLHGFFGETSLARADEVVAHTKARGSRRAFEHLVVDDEAGLRIRALPPTTVPLPDLGEEAPAARDAIDEVLATYSGSLSSDRRALLAQFTPVDAARHVVGVGSVGTECYVLLFTGRDELDPFFLQVKQAYDSVVTTARGRATDLEPGDRVVRGQRLLQATSDIFLGWCTTRAGAPRSFYVRQLYDHKASVDVEGLDAARLAAYGRVCAWVLARAHARSGLSREIAGYLGQGNAFATAMTEFALAYRDRNEADFHTLIRAIEDGRVDAAT